MTWPADMPPPDSAGYTIDLMTGINSTPFPAYERERATEFLTCPMVIRGTWTIWASLLNELQAHFEGVGKGWMVADLMTPDRGVPGVQPTLCRLIEDLEVTPNGHDSYRVKMAFEVPGMGEGRTENVSLI